MTFPVAYFTIEVSTHINIKLGINFILNIIKEAFFFVHTKNVSNGILNISYGIPFDHS